MYFKSYSNFVNESVQTSPTYVAAKEIRDAVIALLKHNTDVLINVTKWTTKANKPVIDHDDKRWTYEDFCTDKPLKDLANTINVLSTLHTLFTEFIFIHTIIGSQVLSVRMDRENCAVTAKLNRKKIFALTVPALDEVFWKQRGEILSRNLGILEAKAPNYSFLLPQIEIVHSKMLEDAHDLLKVDNLFIKSTSLHKNNRVHIQGYDANKVCAHVFNQRMMMLNHKISDIRTADIGTFEIVTQDLKYQAHSHWFLSENNLVIDVFAYIMDTDAGGLRSYWHGNDRSKPIILDLNDKEIPASEVDQIFNYTGYGYSPDVTTATVWNGRVPSGQNRVAYRPTTDAVIRCIPLEFTPIRGELLTKDLGI